MLESAYQIVQSEGAKTPTREDAAQWSAVAQRPGAMPAEQNRKVMAPAVAAAIEVHLPEIPNWLSAIRPPLIAFTRLS